jgi:hypothetical protein
MNLKDFLRRMRGDCYVDGCLDLPVKAWGNRMEIVEWRCSVCKKEHLYFYDIDLMLEKNKWSEKLLAKFIDDNVFRAFLVKHARFERVRMAQVRKGMSDPRKLLMEFYGIHLLKEDADYASKYMYRDELPTDDAIHAMKERFDANSLEAMIYNDPMRLPGFEGFAGENIPTPQNPKDKNKYYPLKNYFFALNRPMLTYIIDWFAQKEIYEAIPLLNSRLSLLPADWPDYSSCIINEYLERVQKRKESQEKKIAENRKYFDRYKDLIEKPMPELAGTEFLPYPYPLNDVFYYYDWSDHSGEFSANESKYFAGELGNYEIFKLALKEARGKKFTLGHSHYLIRNKEDHGEHCRAILLLEDGDTVVNVFYHLNPYKFTGEYSYSSIRRDHDIEMMELGIRYLLQKLLPAHFKVAIRPGVCD